MTQVTGATGSSTPVWYKPPTPPVWTPPPSSKKKPDKYKQSLASLTGANNMPMQYDTPVVRLTGAGQTGIKRWNQPLVNLTGAPNVQPWMSTTQHSAPAWLQYLHDRLLPAAGQANAPAWLQYADQRLFSAVHKKNNVPSGGQAEQSAPPWRIQGPNGEWMYLQPDGTYLAPTGTAGGVGDMGTLHNSYTNLANFPMLQPPPAQESPFGTYYGGWGRGGGGGYTPPAPNWLMGLNSWKFGE